MKTAAFWLRRAARCRQACMVALLLTSSARLKAEQTFIRANQIGYSANVPKNAIAFSARPITGSFNVVEISTGKPVFQGVLKPIERVKWGTNENHWELDFSHFKKEGRYTLQVDDARALPFAIRKDVFSEMPDRLLAFMREQRCGYNPWLNAVCHAYDGRTAFGPHTNGTYLDARGGWHDAADLLKYLLTSGNATAQMLLAYQLAELPVSSPSPQGKRRNKAGPQIFEDRFNALGQAGSNGIADVLDEARWG